MSHHVHILISIPPTYSVAQVVGFIKGKSAISIARTYMGRRQHFTGQSFWARGYYVSLKNRNLVKDILRIIHLQFGFSRFISFREEDL